MTFLDAFGVDLSDPLHALGLSAALLVLVALALSTRSALRAARETDALRRDVAALQRTQAEASGAQAQASQALDARVAGLTSELGQNLSQSATSTAHSLGALQERLEAIDRAQRNIEKLSGDVLSLQDILSNKQARGAFGEIQLHDILSKALPAGSYRWQATLANGTRADCIIDLPDPPGAIVIDAKFPLEPYEAMLGAQTETEQRDAARAFRTAIRAHIKAISEKYILPGDTADSALMFLPSEAVYAELHGTFPDLVREGFSARVWTVSPTTCMALLNTLRAVLKDARMREEANAIRATLRLLHRDIDLVATRVDKLRTHFSQAQGDLDGISKAADRAMRRADQLETFEFDEARPAPARPTADTDQKRDIQIFRR